MNTPNDQPRDFGCAYGLIFAAVTSILLWTLAVKFTLWLIS